MFDWNRSRVGAICAVIGLGLTLGCASSRGPEDDPKTQIEKRANAKYNLGVDHLNNGRNAMALRELLQAQEMNPGDPWIQMGLAEAYRRQNHTDEAILHLERAMALNPDLQSARLNLSAVYIQVGNFEMAAYHAQVLVDDPTFPAPWRGLTNLGWAQYRLGRTDEAYRNLRLATQYNERYWPAALNLGILENERGKRLEAMELFQRVIDLEPGPLPEAEAHYRIAEIFIALGQQQKALPHLAASVEAKPNGKWGPKSEAYLNLLR